MSKEAPLEFTVETEENTVRDEEQFVRASSASHSRPEQQSSGQANKTKVSFADEKIELAAEVRKSLIRDASALIVPPRQNGQSLYIEETDQDTISDPSKLPGYGKQLIQSVS